MNDKVKAIIIAIRRCLESILTDIISINDLNVSMVRLLKLKNNNL